MNNIFYIVLFCAVLCSCGRPDTPKGKDIETIEREKRTEELKFYHSTRADIIRAFAQRYTEALKDATARKDYHELDRIKTNEQILIEGFTDREKNLYYDEKRRLL